VSLRAFFLKNGVTAVFKLLPGPQMTTAGYVPVVAFFCPGPIVHMCRAAGTGSDGCVGSVECTRLAVFGKPG